MPSSALVQAMAALEEWLANEGEERRVLAVQYADGWRASLGVGQITTEHTGVTLADALAQAAQVVVADPGGIGTGV